MTLEVLPNQKKFSAQDHQYQQLRSRMSVIVTRLEQLKTKLKAQDRNGQSTNIVATATNNQNISQAFNSAVSAKFPSLVSRNSTDVKSSKSASFPQLSGISAVEIQTLLANSSPRILFIDVRPLEEFIQGHIGWRSIQSPPAAGVINIEPDWLKEGVTDADINQYLTSFGSSSNTAKILFDARLAIIADAQVNMILFQIANGLDNILR
jgi:rhodanese-related sulfurtransferase